MGWVICYMLYNWQIQKMREVEVQRLDFFRGNKESKWLEEKKIVQ